jgi:hypothetical protein
MAISKEIEMSDQVNHDDAGAAGFWPASGVDLNHVTAGATFQATWGYTNTGTTTWDARYKFAYTLASHSETVDYARSPMGTQVAFPITDLGAPATVPPGATIRLTLTLTAPPTPATHATNWQLQTPDGQRFGPIRWLRVVAKEVKTTEPTHETADFNPESWRSTIFSITSVFESGRPEGRPDAYQNADAGIVSYGKHQATLQSGNLERVLSAYFRRSTSASRQALQQEYAHRVAAKDPSLRHDTRFKELLLQAAHDPEMGKAQEEVFEQNFYRPVIEQAKQIGIKTPLGLACLYDTRIQGGLQDVVTAVSQQLGTATVGETNRAGQVDEPTWLRTFLKEREARLNRLADRRAAENKHTDAKWLRTSIFRVTELRKLLEEGNLTLAGELMVRNQRIQGLDLQLVQKASEKASDKPAVSQHEKAATIDLLLYIKGDGRQYELFNAKGSQERLQTQEDGANFYQVKNTQWEQFFHDDQFIYRDVDTSPGAGRFYRVRDEDLPRGSRWLRRHMAVGEQFVQARQVQFYSKADGSKSSLNSGPARDQMRFVAHHQKYKFRTGIELEDVIQLEWVNGGETYFYARGYGLVGWERTHQDPHTPAWSAISEIHRHGTREPFVREPVSVV